MSIFVSLFGRIHPSKIADEQLYDAQIKLAEHSAAAEHHAALAKMYAERIARLTGNIVPEAPKEAVLPELIAPAPEPVQERVIGAYRNLNRALQGGFRRGEVPVFFAQSTRNRA